MYNIYSIVKKAILSKKSDFDWVCVYFKSGLPALIIFSLCLVLPLSLQAQELSVRQSESCACTYTGKDTGTGKKLFYFALKNNLLYDAALLPNLTAEVYLGNQLSLAVEGNRSWWSTNNAKKSDRFYRIQSAGVELRYWFNSIYPLHGHAVGIYSMVGDYDIRLFSENELSKGWLSYGSWSAGLSYAYSMPVTRRVNLEFSLAAGYLGGKYYDYNYCMMHEKWEWQALYNRKYFGPTRIGVSVVWQFEKKKKNTE